MSQARAVVALLQQHLLPAYREFHRDLLWHQSDSELWRPLFLGRRWRPSCRRADRGTKPSASSRRARNAERLHRLSAGRRARVRRQMEPYAHERVRPIPLYIQDVGVAPGRTRN